jgi:orotate phosphoribosyltransferase
MTPDKEVLARILLKLEVVAVNTKDPFRLTSGKTSPVYFDCRRLISNPAAMATVIGQWAWNAETVGARYVVGGESAGIPFASHLAHSLGKHLLYARKGDRSHGKVGKLEGLPPRYALGSPTAVLVEDMITDGGSKLPFVQAIREADLEVNHVFVVLDREQGGERLLRDNELQLFSLITAREVLDIGRELDLLSPEDHRAATDAL